MKPIKKQAEQSPAKREDREVAVSIKRQFIQHHSGPLPPPEMLEKYERLLPGAAERLFQMAEKEQAHQHKTIAEVTKSVGQSQKRGQVLGFILAMSALISSVVLYIYSGSLAISGLLLGAGVMAVAIALISGRSEK